MSVLRQSELSRRLKLEISDPKSIVITPLLQEKDVFDVDSIDLRLGSYFLLLQVPPEPFFYPSKGFANKSHFRVHVPLGSYLVVPAHQTVLGATLEFIKLPIDLCGQILTKSTIARTFMVIETAPWIHPSYRGCLTLEIANVSNTPLLLYPGRLIGQLILLQLAGRPTKKQANPKVSGTYVGPVYPEAPVFDDPENDLQKIGVVPGEMKFPGVSARRRP